MRSKASPAPHPPRTSVLVAAEIADLDAIAGERSKALVALEAQRPGLIEVGDVDGVEALDARIRRARIEGEVDAAKREKLAAEHDRLKAAEEHRADQVARRAAFAAAQAAADEARILFQERYPALARELASLLTHTAECRSMVEAANERLPEGEAPIPLDFEPSGGRAAIPATSHKVRRHLWVHTSGKTSVLTPPDAEKGWKRQIREETVTSDALPAVPHIPLGDLVSLPGLRFGDAPFWAPALAALAKPAVPRENWMNFIQNPTTPSPAPAQPAGVGR